MNATDRTMQYPSTLLKKIQSLPRPLVLNTKVVYGSIPGHISDRIIRYPDKIWSKYSSLNKVEREKKFRRRKKFGRAHLLFHAFPWFSYKTSFFFVFKTKCLVGMHASSTWDGKHKKLRDLLEKHRTKSDSFRFHFILAGNFLPREETYIFSWNFFMQQFLSTHFFHLLPQGFPLYIFQGWQ